MYHENCPCGGSQTDAIVAGVRQQLCQVYEAEQALCRGTLFPELDKPLSCVRNTCTPCATQEHVNDFAAWELRLYLNTNPCDKKALKLYRHFCRKLNGSGYACVKTGGCPDACSTAPARTKPCCDNDISFARAVKDAGDDGFIRVGCPVKEKDAFVRVTEDDDCGDARWTWADEPWPWEKTAVCRKEG